MIRRSIFTAILLSVAASAPAFAQCDTRFTITNRSSSVVNELYFGRTTNPNWGQDRLGSNVLPSGGSLDFRPSPGGAYDFRIVFANGQARERRNVDLCSVGTIIVQNNGISVE